MKEQELSCEIIRDLLPSYVNGLLSPETGEAVEKHLASCESCSKQREAVSVCPPPPDTETEGHGPLKKRKRLSVISIVIAVLCTAILLFAAVGAKLFVLGTAADRECMGWQAFVDSENVLNLNIYATWSSLAYSHWNIKNTDGVINITARKSIASPVHSDGDYAIEIPLSDIKEIYLFGTLLWQDGTVLRDDTLKLYETHAPYVGNVTSLDKISSALHIRELCGSYLINLQTIAEPYGWTLEFSDKYGADEETLLNLNMHSLAFKMLALVDNLGEVSWTYTDSAGEKQTRKITLEEANAALPELVAEYNASNATKQTAKGSVKDYTKSATTLQQLCDLLK